MNNNTSSLNPTEGPSFSQMIGYGAGNFGFMMAWIPANLFLLNLYTDVYGMSGSQAGLIFLIALIWDGVTDPPMGWIVDRTKSRWGGYRPYILFGTPPLAVSFVLAFTRFDASDPALIFTLALVTHLLFRTAFTVVYVPYTGMIAVLSGDSDIRSKIAGVKVFFVFLAFLAIALVIPTLVAKFGSGDTAKGYFLVALLLSTVILLFGIITFFSTQEQNYISRSDRPRPHFKELIRFFAKNWPFALICLGVISYSTAFGIYNATIIYMSKYYLTFASGNDYSTDDAIVGIILTPQFIAALIGVPFWIWFTLKTSKRVTWMAAAIVASAGLLSIWLIQPDNVRNLTLCYCLTGFASPAYIMTFYAMTADAIDYGHWASGVRVEAMSYGFLSFANKAAGGLGALILGIALDKVGYIANQPQTSEAAEGIVFISTVLPATGFLVTIIVIALYPLNSDRHRFLREELTRRN